VGKLFGTVADFFVLTIQEYYTVYNVIRFLRVKVKFGTSTVVSVNGTLVEDKMRRFKSECAQLSFNKCPIYTHDDALTQMKCITVYV
jgi:hypothetical protein